MSATLIPPVTPGTRPDLAEIEELISAGRFGEVPLLYQVLLQSPPIAEGWERMLTAVRFHTEVPARLRELVIVRIAVLNDASYEFAAHAPLARAAGASEAAVDAVSTWPANPEPFDDDEQLALELTDHVTRDVQVPSEMIGRVRERFGDRGVVELVTTIAAYNMVSRVLVALNIVH